MNEAPTIVVPQDFQCLECGRKLTLEEAERVIDEGDGCPGCGGSDIDIATD